MERFDLFRYDTSRGREPRYRDIKYTIRIQSKTAYESSLQSNIQMLRFNETHPRRNLLTIYTEGLKSSNFWVKAATRAQETTIQRFELKVCLDQTHTYVKRYNDTTWELRTQRKIL